MCVCVYRLNRRKTSYFIYLYAGGHRGPWEVGDQRRHLPGTRVNDPRDCGDAPGRNCKTQLVVTIVPYIYIFHPYLSN